LGVTSGTGVNPISVLRSRAYLKLVVLAGLIGIPISAGAYWFLEFTNDLQGWVFTNLPHAAGYHSAPSWWPVPVLTVSGVLVAMAIRFLPGPGGHIPAEGLKVGGIFGPTELIGVLLAALAGLGLGVVLGPEAPLIALGSGVAALAVRWSKAGSQAMTMIAAAGSFAAVSALFGSPILAAFLLMEVIGLGGGMLGVVLLPGLLASGIGALVFVGLGNWTGKGTFSLIIPNLPKVGTPTWAGLGWALVIGVVAAVLGTLIHRPALWLSRLVQPRILLYGPIVGLAVGGLAWLYVVWSGHPLDDILFSGQNELPTLLTQASTYGVWALIGIVAFKGLAYVLCLASFRGGPVFPSLFLGAALGIAMSHLPGLPMVSGAAMGIGAMSVSMLRLPLTCVLLATLLFAQNSTPLTPLVIVAVVVSYLLTIWLNQPASSTTVSSGPGEGASTGVTGRS
jgi:H+/Cl- antiporter ClcA